MSKKRARLMRGARGDLNRDLRITPRRCELGPIFAAHGTDSGCEGRATAWHELRKRSSSGSIINRDNAVPACTSCNHYVETHPILARELGLVIRPGDPRWEELGVRNDA